MYVDGLVNIDKNRLNGLEYWELDDMKKDLESALSSYPNRKNNIQSAINLIKTHEAAK
jgi:hypothetical protein